MKNKFQYMVFIFFLSFNVANTPPISPIVYFKADSGKVILNWDGSQSLSSKDDVTGYYDFEGFRIYKSIDGGMNWGGADDRVYHNGNFVGWRPYAQFDLSESDDRNFCVLNSPSECDIEVDVLRGHEVSGLDPAAPWVNLGSNTGIEYSFVDSDVINGVEYTYAVVSFDMGLKTSESQYLPTANGFCSDSDGISTTTTYENCCSQNCGVWNESLESCDFTNYSLVDSDLDNIPDCPGLLIPNWDMIYEQSEVWPSSNPDEIDVAYASQESISAFALSSLIGSNPNTVNEMDNVITAIPGFYAENLDNISFDGIEDAIGVVMEADSLTIGNGGQYFTIINEADLTENVYRFEIQASEELVDIFEDYKTGDPRLYAYQVESVSSLFPTSTIQINAPVSSSDAVLLEGLYNLSLPNSCTNLFSFNYANCLLEFANQILDFPGVVQVSEGIYDMPVYVIDNFRLKYSDESGYSTNYTDFFDGVRYRFDNSLKFPVTNAEIKRITHMTKDSVFTVLGEYDVSVTDVVSLFDFGVQLAFGNSGGAFNSKPSYSYKIIFSDTPDYEVLETNESCVAGWCSVEGYFTESECEAGGVGGEWTLYEYSREKSSIPFEVVNINTGKKVGVYHTDKGVNYGRDEGACDPVCGLTQWCDNGSCKDLVGYRDCTWQVDEPIAFKEDTVMVGGDVTGYYTFDIRLSSQSYNIYKNFSPRYNDEVTYSEGDVVRYNKMLYEAQSLIPAGTMLPTDYYDPDGDGLNSNPWKTLYWFEDGDELIIDPVRWYVDGDSWVADVGKLGIENAIIQSDLDDIKVVPNPYYVYSDFVSDANSGLMWFTHLPNKCEISIYTVSGQLVKTFSHDDEFSGQAFWDLKTGNGDMVAPGLYLYTVQAGGSGGKDFKHIGKFYIVR